MFFLRSFFHGGGGGGAGCLAGLILRRILFPGQVRYSTYGRRDQAGSNLSKSTSTGTVQKETIIISCIIIYNNDIEGEQQFSLCCKFSISTPADLLSRHQPPHPAPRCERITSIHLSNRSACTPHRSIWTHNLNQTFSPERKKGGINDWLTISKI